jgi:CpXC protein
MAVFHPHTVQCVCGKVIVVQLADSINVKRAPESREKILKGELHREICPSCSREIVIEKTFYYTDLTRNSLFKVCPRGQRHKWKQVSKELDIASSFVPSRVSEIETRSLRVVFGMDELREKLVAQDIRLDDRLIELLKVFLIYEHPILLKRRRLRLLLTGFDEQNLEFNATYEHSPHRFSLKMPRRLVNEIEEAPQRIKQWVSKAHRTNLFDMPDHWVNMWRWSPQPDSLNRLSEYAKFVKQNQDIDTTSAVFGQMLEGLPRGTHLPSWAKQDLGLLSEYAKANDFQDLQEKLFEIRFGIELESDWSVNSDRDDIDTLWQLLKDLPDSNVEGNTKIHELLLNVDEGGGWYSPNTHDIAIGSRELANRESFEDVVRHEVGHAVHEMNDNRVNAWLIQRFGWQNFGTSEDEVNRWVDLMGGWGTLKLSHRREVRDALVTALGGGSSWTPGPTPLLPLGHQWYASNFGPRLAFEKTGSNWFKNNANWYRANGKAFFLNYWYKTLVVVDISTLDMVAKMPSSYASMSHYEFFAELYALYYDLDDPKRTVIPSDVAKWIDANIGSPENGAPIPAAPAAKREWETITRPSAKSARSAKKSKL